MQGFACVPQWWSIKDEDRSRNERIDLDTRPSVPIQVGACSGQPAAIVTSGKFGSRMKLLRIPVAAGATRRLLIIGGWLFTVLVGGPGGHAAGPAVAGGGPRPAEAPPIERSPPAVVDAMLGMAGVRATDFLIDLGGGDGGIVIRAAKEFGARGFGVDANARQVAVANEKARNEGVADRIRFMQQDLFKTDLGSATVVTMHLTAAYNMTLRDRLFALKPGTRIVSRDWDRGDWQADARLRTPASDKAAGKDGAGWIYLWVVPAKVGGNWRSQMPTDKGWIDIELKFDQAFHKISGEARLGDSRLALERVSLGGDFLSFRIEVEGETILFNGHVQNGRIVGQVTPSGGRTLRWRALRSGA